MEIGKKFNQLSVKEYCFYIDNHKKYTDFNTLGLYRSIPENEKLSTEEKIQVRDYANTIFEKTFDFLQLKDPDTYFNVATLGQTLTQADEKQFWRNVIANQQKILKDKKIKHRNFGSYFKHMCGYDSCPALGLMLKPGTSFLRHNMRFPTDKKRDNVKEKSKKQEKEGKKVKRNLRKWGEGEN